VSCRRRVFPEVVVTVVESTGLLAVLEPSIWLGNADAREKLEDWLKINESDQGGKPE